MTKIGILAAAALVAAVAAPAAHAAQVIVFDGTSGTFGNANIGGGNFTNTFDINTSQAGTIALTISSTRTSALTNLDFVEVSLNGQNFTVGVTGINEFRFLNNLALMAGKQTLVVRGKSGGNGSYSGTVNFSPTGGVPEPATWAMMIGGMGAAGYGLRRRRSLVAA